MNEVGNSVQGSIKSFADLFGKTGSRQSIEEAIKQSYAFYDWEGIRPEDQERILLFLEGKQGLQILSDKFFQRVFRPDEVAHRLKSYRYYQGKALPYPRVAARSSWIS